jgi:hypothetical protein
MRLPRIAFVLVLCSILCSLSSQAFASTIVIPNANATMVGNAPDATGGEIGMSFHFQELYGSGQFMSVGGPILIYSLAWRSVPGTGPFLLTADNFDLYLSTSPRFPNQIGGGPALLMSPTFADNVGPDNTLVFHGPVTLSSPGCAAGPTPCAFDLSFTFQTPFLYNPFQGRLLLDGVVTNFTSAGGTLDGVSFTPFGSMASVFALVGNASGEFDASGTITQLGFTAVPEPATATLLLTGFGAAAAARRRRKN